MSRGRVFVLFLFFVFCFFFARALMQFVSRLTAISQSGHDDDAALLFTGFHPSGTAGRRLPGFTVIADGWFVQQGMPSADFSVFRFGSTRSSQT